MMSQIHKSCNYLVQSLLVLACFAGPVYADQDLKKVADQISREFLSPYCPGRSLADCPSQRASDLKKRILNDLQRGKTKSEVMTALMAEFGENLNAKPKFTGFSLFAWLVPGIFLIIFFVLGLKWLKNNFRS